MVTNPGRKSDDCGPIVLRTFIPVKQRSDFHGTREYSSGSLSRLGFAPLDYLQIYPRY
jgi:hypothetical protein